MRPTGDGHVGAPRLALVGFRRRLGHQLEGVGLLVCDLELALRGLQLDLRDLATVLCADQGRDLVLEPVGSLLQHGGPALEHGGEGVGHRLDLRGQPGVLDGAEDGVERLAHGAPLQLQVVRNGQLVGAGFGKAEKLDLVIGGHGVVLDLDAPGSPGLGGKHRASPASRLPPNPLSAKGYIAFKRK